MYNPHYLTLSRHNIYYLRFPLPPALHPQGLDREIRLSLRTREPKEALRISRSLLNLGANLTSNPVMALMDFQEIRDVLIDHFKIERERVKERINKFGPLQAHEQQAYSNKQNNAITALANNDHTLLGTDQELQSIIELQALPIKTGSKDYTVLRNEYLKAARDSSRDILKLNSKYDGYEFTTDPRFIDIRKAEKKARKTKLADIINNYVTEKKRLKQWTTKSAAGFRKQFDLLLEYVGSDASVHISASVANDVKTMLMQLPKQARTKPALKHLSLQDILALPENHPIKADNLMEPANIHKYISAYSSFFDWAVKRKDTDENNFKGINVRIDKQEQKRDAFTSEQMTAIYKAVQKEERDHYKWGALIACFTGARLEEIAQLYVSDIQREGNIWFFNINDDGEKKLKNKSSKRTVPIHSKLIELGFLDYVTRAKKDGHERILFGLSKAGNNGYGRNLGRWFNDTLLPELGIKKKVLSFHSFRHWVLTALQQSGVEDSLAKRLVGHTQVDVMNLNYAKGQIMAQRLS